MAITRTELLRELARGIDPVAFARSLGFPDLDNWQRDLLLSTEEHIILNCARQSGKSLICAILGLYEALNTPGSLVLILSPSLRQSGELFKKIQTFYRELAASVAVTETVLTLTLSNRSRIVSLPGTEKTVRGFSGASLLLIDEAARVEDELYFAVRPMLAVSGGRVILLSTPAGKRGFFYREWTEGSADEWLKVRITADQCPRISKAFLLTERETMSQYWFEQEYYCEFHESQTSLFRFDVIEQSIKDFPELEFEGLDDIDDARRSSSDISQDTEEIVLDLD